MAVAFNLRRPRPPFSEIRKCERQNWLQIPARNWCGERTFSTKSVTMQTRQSEKSSSAS
eukprot:c5662_g1_i2 orf=3-176(-)